MNCFRALFSGGAFSKSITSSFLSLIPKSSNPLGLDDYRLICLVGSIYKVISKVLAGRIKRVLHSIVSPCQSAFVSGRQLLDGVLVANELLDFSLKEGKSCLLFKVDFEKAYDKVSWNFLRFMLKRMGFGELWIKWMEILIFSSKMSVLVNGSPSKEFMVERGLRQGDPLSPFLFVLVAEGLKILVDKAVQNGDFVGCDVKGG
ncbi:secreted RxLR effector protein 78-like [Vicia villosa]|uniref:secreted RxLR effector protein 78-like n=1 Tax=Vicia villosa TaxID=3911 RepID=UPI00273CE0A7|nr:secreted RxLR effector protein 78-like [Vicia villosa]